MDVYLARASVEPDAPNCQQDLLQFFQLRKLYTRLCKSDYFPPNADHYLKTVDNTKPIKTYESPLGLARLAQEPVSHQPVVISPISEQVMNSAFTLVPGTMISKGEKEKAERREKKRKRKEQKREKKEKKRRKKEKKRRKKEQEGEAGTVREGSKSRDKEKKKKHKKDKTQEKPIQPQT
eukprot:GILJ01008005.1.p1 GENE.GILJ01008005.1~~GILJ01008005.1.p1  ORF type:complete len:179 (-),score=41.20 GILJ01008005.1:252-788(-)